MRRGPPFDELSEAIQEFNDASTALNEALWEARGDGHGAGVRFCSRMLRYRLLVLFPFLSRWLEVAPACCGVCPMCVGTAAGSLLLPLLVRVREKP
jgi:hypothetical protein